MSKNEPYLTYLGTGSKSGVPVDTRYFMESRGDTIDIPHEVVEPLRLEASERSVSERGAFSQPQAKKKDISLTITALYPMVDQKEK